MCAIRGERTATRHWMHSECAISPEGPATSTAATGMLVRHHPLVIGLCAALEYLQPGSYRLAAAESCRRPERICSTLSVATPRWTEGPGQHPRVSRECASLRDSCLAGRFGGRRGACRCVRSKSRAESLLEHPGRTELRAGGVYLHAGQRGDGCVAPDQGFHGPDEWPRCGLRAHPRPMGPVREARPDRALRLAFGQRPRWQDRAANERFPDSPIPVSGFP